MFIKVHELELHEVVFREEFRPDVIDLGPDLRQLTPLRSAGRAALIEEHYGARKKIQDIRLLGELSTSIELKCARCLEPVVRDVGKSFDLLYRPQGADAGREELSVTQAEAEIGYYTGEGLLLEDALREQVLLALPIKAVCREECKGLCPHCGRNWNVETCNCAQPVADSRWQALKELRDKLEG